MAVEPKLSDQEITSLLEIPHPSKGLGESIYGATKVFPDYQAEPGETYLGMVHESSVSFVAVLLAIRAQRKGFDSALYFFGIGALNCLATRGFPDIGTAGPRAGGFDVEATLERARRALSPIRDLRPDLYGRRDAATPRRRDAAADSIKDTVDEHIARDGTDARPRSATRRSGSRVSRRRGSTSRRPASVASCGAWASGPTTAASRH